MTYPVPVINEQQCHVQKKHSCLTQHKLGHVVTSSNGNEIIQACLCQYNTMPLCLQLKGLNVQQPATNTIRSKNETFNRNW